MHVRHVAVPGPSHVSQLKWHAVHRPAAFLYMPAGQLARHAPLCRFCLRHGCGLPKRGLYFCEMGLTPTMCVFSPTPQEPRQRRHVVPSAGLQAAQSKLPHGQHSPLVPCGHVPLSPHGILHAPPARVAPVVQSEVRNFVSGVGSTHFFSPGPLHSWQPAWQLVHTLEIGSAYVPAGHSCMHVLWSRKGLIVVGHLDLEHTLGLHERHSLARGPAHVLQSAWHGWHSRESVSSRSVSSA